MEKKVYSVDGKELRTINLDDNVFGLPLNEDVIYYAITNELANKRVGTACTKTRAEVHGSNKKPYKQKGTGNARRGDKKSPITVGGGTIFGPKPRDYSYAIPKKEKRLAMKTILSMQAQSDRLVVIEDFTVQSGKTKDLVKILNNFAKNTRTVVILNDIVDEENVAEAEKDIRANNALLRRAGGNIPTLTFLSYKCLRAHDLFYGRKIILLEGAAKNLSGFYAVQRGAK
ncbi:MAG: 50S ribosomal protein L4 [Treponema sp.]|nr:50S ribosomal protein L4 [Treponema sp.]